MQLQLTDQPHTLHFAAHALAALRRHPASAKGALLNSEQANVHCEIGVHGGAKSAYMHLVHMSNIRGQKDLKMS